MSALAMESDKKSLHSVDAVVQTEDSCGQEISEVHGASIQTELSGNVVAVDESRFECGLLQLFCVLRIFVAPGSRQAMHRALRMWNINALKSTHVLKYVWSNELACQCVIIEVCWQD
jgi:hypothetical protein